LERDGRTQGVEWVQFRLNEREDDIEILQPVRALRQKGYEAGEQYCSREDARHMNQSFTQAVPFNADASEWADVNHFGRGRIAALKYRYNAKTRLYEWVEMGPWFADPAISLSEAALAPWQGAWVISARTGHPEGRIAWTLAKDPFAEVPAPTYPPEPLINAPQSAFMCPDGVLRLFTGSHVISPYHNGRDPLYCWDIDPANGFAASSRRIILDSVATGILRRETGPRVDMCKLVPHGGPSDPESSGRTGGREQIVAFRVRIKAVNQPYAGLAPATADDKARCAIHYARITYTEAYPGRWAFARTA
jgi:hypothetical protein